MARLAAGLMLLQWDRLYVYVCLCGNMCVCVCVSGALAISDITVGEIFGPDVPDTVQRASDVVSSKLETSLSLCANLRNRDLLVPPYPTLIIYMRNHVNLFKFVCWDIKSFRCQCMYLFQF